MVLIFGMIWGVPPILGKETPISEQSSNIYVFRVDGISTPQAGFHPYYSTHLRPTSKNVPQQSSAWSFQCRYGQVVHVL